MNHSITLNQVINNYKLEVELYNVEDKNSASEFYPKLMKARVDNEITWGQYFLLLGEFYLQCQREKIESPKQ